MGIVSDEALEGYATVRLTSDLDGLTENERAMIPLLIDAADCMNDIYWLEIYGPRESLLASISDPDLRHRVDLNFGPWDRMEADAPFVPDAGPRPKGARFYPTDMTVDEFEAAADQHDIEGLRSHYTVVARNAEGLLGSVPYHQAFRREVRAAATLLREAAGLADDDGLRRYLELRATALETDDYRASDNAWMDMKSNTLDIVIGPIEVYDDKLLALKASHEGIVLIKDREWSGRLAHYADLLPSLQAQLPVPPAYRSERPGLDADLNAYDAIYHAGFANARPTSSAINLPNDEEIAIARGTRRLQLKNVMRAKFDTIVRPIADLLVAEDQRSLLTFDAWFELLMFHEIAHGLGIHRTLDGSDTVGGALREQATPLEEQKADVVGLFMLARVRESGESGIAPKIAHHVAHLVDFFRMLRFGGASPYALSAASQLNFLLASGAVLRDAASGTYRIDVDRATTAVEEMAATLLTLQGDGDHEGAKAWYRSTGAVGNVQHRDLDRLAGAAVPIDVIYEQGLEVLGLA
jgi:hypothetical protein